ncbi:MAG: amidohydrolase [Nitrososphaerales archaeon]
MTKLANCKLVGVPHNRLYDISIQNGLISMISKASANLAKSDYDAKGRFVLPAFIDSHCHLFSLGDQLGRVDLRGSRSIVDFQRRITTFVKQNSPRNWILGKGWNQELFSEKRMPHRRDIDKVCPDYPVVLVRICGHIAVLNTRALDYFKKRGAFNNIPKELLDLDPKGKPTGIVKEIALHNCWSAMPPTRSSEYKKALERAQSIALTYGVLGAHCILDDWQSQLKAIKELTRENKLILKLVLFLPISALSFVEGMEEKKRSEFLRGKNFEIVGFKVFTDGSLGARTAALNNDYTDDQGNNGVLYYSTHTLVNFSRRALRLGLVIATHAIGDKALEQTIEAYKRANVSKKDRYRIEHCSIVNARVLRNLHPFVISIQPMFATSDFWALDRIGKNKEKRQAYPFKTLFRKSLCIGGSDAPVESLDPITGINASMKNKIDAKESLSEIQALKLYTKNPSQLYELTRNLGSIQIGKSASLVVLEGANLSRSKVSALFLDGKQVFSL